MQMIYEIPDGFWSLFRSVNREAYMEALLAINEEYQYNNYFLSRDVCIQVLSDFYAKRRIQLEKEENEPGKCSGYLPPYKKFYRGRDWNP